MANIFSRFLLRISSCDAVFRNNGRLQAKNRAKGLQNGEKQFIMFATGGLRTMPADEEPMRIFANSRGQELNQKRCME